MRVSPILFPSRTTSQHAAGTTSLAMSLTGLPRTALPTDIRRLCGKSKIENVVNGALSFSPLYPMQ